MRALYLALIVAFCLSWNPVSGTDRMPVDTTALVRVGRIHGGLSPKSIAWNGHGLFFAQNMMYRHSVTVFDESMQRCGTISDRVVLEDLGVCGRPGSYRGAPVECIFSADGRHAFVSNYSMEGEGFNKPGCDGCHSTDHDGSFVYRINTATMEVDAAYPTGSVPKFLALTPDERTLLVSNWSSGDVSMIDLSDEGPALRLNVGRYPRGLAVDPSGRYAYVAIMGGSSIKRIHLETHAVEHFATVGRGPRHLCMDSTGTTLYASLNHEGAIARIDIASRKVDKLHVGGSPRSMAFGYQEHCLYVVNYGTALMTKVDLAEFRVSAVASTDTKPIGITYDARNARIWVACYSGSILVYEDRGTPGSAVSRPEPLPLPMGPLDTCTTLLSAATSNKANAPRTFPKAVKDEVPKASVPAIIRGGISVVAGSFRDRSNAERQAVRLGELGFDPVVEVPTTAGGFYRVLAGTFGTSNEAGLCRDRLAERSIKAWVERP